MSDENTNRPGNRIHVGDYYIAPESVSARRASALLPTKGSEDVSSILGSIAEKRIEIESEAKDYLPSTASEWVIHVDLEFPQELAATSVDKVFGQEWRARGGRNSTIYGKEAQTNHWTFLVAADAPKSITALQFAWPYFATWTGETGITKSVIYETRLKEIASGIGKLARAKVHTEVQPAAAQERCERLAALNEQFDRQITLLLKAPSNRRFSGRDVWDVMLCLGLQWGDMDCFHWRNRSDQGDDNFFSVSTTTSPGYFLPEEIAANRVAVEDLVFGYSLPRSADPVTVYERMFAATEYAQRRLGGTIQTETGSALDFNATRDQIRSAVQELEALGFPPGTEQALRFF